MKSCISTLLILFFFISTAYSQIGPGWYAGGSMGFSMDRNTYPDTTYPSQINNYNSVSFSPNVGYFFTERFSLSLGLGYSYGFNNSEGYSYNLGTGEVTPTSGKSQRHNLGVSLSANYVIPMGEKFAFLSSLFVGYGGAFGTEEYFINGVSDGKSPSSKNMNYSAGLRPQFLFFPVPKVGLSVSFGDIVYYRHSTNRDQNGSITSKTSDLRVLNLRSGGLSFGANYFFNRG